MEDKACTLTFIIKIFKLIVLFEKWEQK